MRVFIADDSAVLRESLKQVLAESGCCQIEGEAEEASQAIEAIRQLAPDVVILDIQMPGGGGMRVLQELRSRTGGPKVIVFTAYPFPQYRRAFLAAGADFFLEKGGDGRQIVELLTLLANGDEGMPSLPDGLPGERGGVG